MEALYYIIPAIIFVVLIKLGMRAKLKKIEGQPAPDYAPFIDAKFRNQPRLLFYFYGANCGPCKAIAPMIDQMAEKHDNLVKVDVAEKTELARAFKVMGTPSFVLVNNGAIEKVMLGAQGLGKLEKLLAA